MSSIPDISRKEDVSPDKVDAMITSLDAKKDGETLGDYNAKNRSSPSITRQKRQKIVDSGQGDAKPANRGDGQSCTSQVQEEVGSFEESEQQDTQEASQQPESPTLTGDNSKNESIPPATTTTTSATPTTSNNVKSPPIPSTNNTTKITEVSSSYQQARSVMESIKQSPLTNGAPISTDDLSNYIKTVLGEKASSSLVSLTQPLPPMNPYIGPASPPASHSSNGPGTAPSQHSEHVATSHSGPPVIVQGMTTAALNNMMNSIINCYQPSPLPLQQQQQHLHPHQQVLQPQHQHQQQQQSLMASPNGGYLTPQQQLLQQQYQHQQIQHLHVAHTHMHSPVPLIKNMMPSVYSESARQEPMNTDSLLEPGSPQSSPDPTPTGSTDNTQLVDITHNTSIIPSSTNTSTAILPHNPQPLKGTYVDVTEYLAMPQTEAARRLGIPTSTLSKRWKEASVNRKWPHRVVSKIDKEIMTLLHNIPRGDNAPLPAEIEQSLGELLRKRADELRTVIIRF